jgi:hypothetical protein
VGTFTWQPFLEWHFPTSGPQSAGLLLNGGTMKIEYDVLVQRVLDCVKQPGGDFLGNQAFFNLTTASGVTIADLNAGNDTVTSADVAVNTGAYIVDPDCGVTIPGAPPPLLAITKVQLPAVQIGWPGSANYRIQVKNNGSTPIANINLRDFMREDPGTPPHKVQLTAWNCTSSPSGAACAFVVPAGPFGPVQPQQFYFSAKQMWSGTIPSLAPGQTLTLNISVAFTDPTCDSLDAIVPNTNTNVARASYKANVLINSVPTLVTYYLVAAVTTPMANVPKCKFDVAKKLTNAPIGFPQTLNYVVAYHSLETVPRQVVVYDALRVVPANYTTGMPFTATYSCAPNAPGSVIPPILIPNGGTNGTVVNTALPSQGVRVFQSAGFLTFAPGATLTCNVSVTVNRPPPSDPYCLGSAPGQLENLGDMTVSLIPDNNIFPPSGPYNGAWPLAASQPPAGPLSGWRSVTSKLPQCFNLVVNKQRSPATTWAGGPPITYTLTVQNLGDPIAPGPNNPVVTDTFTPNHAWSSVVSVLCAPLGPPCAATTWVPNPITTNPSTLTITKLATGQSVQTRFTAGPFAFPPGVVSNTAAAAMGGPNGAQLWYAKNPATLTATATVSVLETNSLTVKKQISPIQGMALPNLTGVNFLINVACTPYGPSTSLHVTAGSPPQVVPNIPINSTCNVAELPVVQTGTCGRPLVSVSLPPTYVPPGQNVTITAPPASLIAEVINMLGCDQLSSLLVIKSVVDETNASLPTVQFPVTITCQPYGNVYNLTLPSTNSSQTVSIPVGSNCTIVEGPLPPPTSNPHVCPNSPHLLGWASPGYVPGPSTVIQPQPAGSNPQNVLIKNAYMCNPP